jgi:hypothetical protein
MAARELLAELVDAIEFVDACQDDWSFELHWPWGRGRGSKPRTRPADTLVRAGVRYDTARDRALELEVSFRDALHAEYGPAGAAVYDNLPDAFWLDDSLVDVVEALLSVPVAP